MSEVLQASVLKGIYDKRHLCQKAFTYMPFSTLPVLHHPVRPIDYVKKKEHDGKENAKNAVHSGQPLSLVQRGNFFFTFIQF